MDEDWPNFDMALEEYLTEPEAKRQKAQKTKRFATLSHTDLDDLVEGAQSKSTTKMTKYAVSGF